MRRVLQAGAWPWPCALLPPPHQVPPHLVCHSLQRCQLGGHAGCCVARGEAPISHCLLHNHRQARLPRLQQRSACTSAAHGSAWHGMAWLTQRAACARTSHTYRCARGARTAALAQPSLRAVPCCLPPPPPPHLPTAPAGSTWPARCQIAGLRRTCAQPAPCAEWQPAGRLHACMQVQPDLARTASKRLCTARTRVRLRVHGPQPCMPGTEAGARKPP